MRGKPEKFADHFTQARLFFRARRQTEKNAHHRRIPLRADQGAASRRSASASSRCSPTSRPSLRRASPTASASPCRRQQPRVLESPAAPEVTTLAGALADGAPGRRQRQDAPRRAARRRRHRRRSRCARSTPRSPPPVPCRASSARASGARPAGRGRADPRRGDDGDRALGAAWDGVVIPGGDAGLAGLGQAVDFVKDQYRHCKTILVLGAASSLRRAGECCRRPCPTAATTRAS